MTAKAISHFQADHILTRFVFPPLETGLRLSQLALKQTYGKRKMPQYPVYKGYSIEGNTLRIHFENLGKGFLHPDPVRGFIIAGTDRIFYPATVTVKKKEIIVQSQIGRAHV